MVRHWLGRVIPDGSAMGQVQMGVRHELALGADALEDHADGSCRVTWASDLANTIGFAIMTAQGALIQQNPDVSARR
jgi:hypothetical protein